MELEDKLPEGQRHRIKIWFDEKRDCWVSDVFFVMKKAKSGDTLYFDETQNPSKFAVANHIWECLNAMAD